MVWLVALGDAPGLAINPTLTARKRCLLVDPDRAVKKSRHIEKPRRYGNSLTEVFGWMWLVPPRMLKCLQRNSAQGACRWCSRRARAASRFAELAATRIGDTRIGGGKLR